ncbi:MAG: S1 RNA-binding domain-containing protein, partial [Ilumatobacteraceae bacterium]
MGTFDDEGNYTPREVVSNDLGMSFADAVDGGDASIIDVDDGQLVHGTVVKIDRDEVLLDIGYKSEGVIPSRELSIRNDVNPAEIVTMGEQVEALVLTKEDK